MLSVSSLNCPLRGMSKARLTFFAAAWVFSLSEWHPDSQTWVSASTLPPSPLPPECFLPVSPSLHPRQLIITHNLDLQFTSFLVKKRLAIIFLSIISNTRVVIQRVTQLPWKAQALNLRPVHSVSYLYIWRSKSEHFGRDDLDHSLMTMVTSHPTLCCLLYAHLIFISIGKIVFSQG